MDEERNGGYSLNITEQGIELFANDYAGIRYGFATLIQILRIFRVGSNKRVRGFYGADWVCGGVFVLLNPQLISYTDLHKN
jgi:N-acetyl-beta-hexosaminidase